MVVQVMEKNRRMVIDWVVCRTLLLENLMTSSPEQIRSCQKTPPRKTTAGRRQEKRTTLAKTSVKAALEAELLVLANKKCAKAGPKKHIVGLGKKEKYR